jgi:RNA polymerase primary sigma factor
MHRSGKRDGSSTAYKSHEAFKTAMARDSIQNYLNEIGRYPLLTKSQEVILGTQVQAWMEIKDKNETEYTEEERRIVRIGRRAKEKFIKCNLRLVVNIARKYVSRCNNLELMDLVQEGNFGLVRAVEKFDPTRGYAMSTYAYWWIRQAIQRSMQFSDATIRLPIGIHETSFKINKSIESLTKRLGREPTIHELSQEADLSIDEIKIATTAPRAYTSLDKQATESEASSALVDIIADEKNSNTLEDAESRINLEDIYFAIDTYLDNMTKLVILERFRDPPTPWKEICEMTNLSRGRLQSIEKAGIQRCALLLSVKNRLEL